MNYMHSAALSSNHPVHLPLQASNKDADETFDDTNELIKRWRENDDVFALHELINMYRPLVESMACKYDWAAMRDDLVSAGNEGLLKAANAFDPNREARFATYARFWVNGALLKCLNLNRNIVKPVPGENAPEFFSLNKAVNRIDEPDGDTWQDRLTNDDEMEIITLRNFLRNLLHKNSSVFDERERSILEVRCLLDKPREELARKLGVSPERIRQIEMRALEKVQKLRGWSLNRAAFLNEQYRPQMPNPGRELFSYKKPQWKGEKRTDKPTRKEHENKLAYLRDYKAWETRLSWSGQP